MRINSHYGENNPLPEKSETAYFDYISSNA